MGLGAAQCPGLAAAGAAVAVALRPERIRLDPPAALDTVLPMTVAGDPANPLQHSIEVTFVKSRNDSAS